MNVLLEVGHAESMAWAISQGVETNGVASAKFPERGLGLVTDRSVKVRALRSSNSFRSLRGQYVDSNTPIERARFGGGVTAMFTVIPFHHPLSPNSQKDLDPWADRRIPHPGIPVT
jgi:hypothetical protein